MDDQRKRLTLAEMAERLNFSPKTLKKHITALRIPHFRVGTSLRFDPDEVEAFFRITPSRPTVKKRVRPVNSPGRFAERLGI